MLHFVATAVMASAVAQTQPPMVRVSMPFIGKQQLSLELPATWKFSITETPEYVKEGGKYPLGRFGIPIPGQGEVRVEFVIYPDMDDLKKRITEEYARRKKELVKDHVKAGDYEGYVVQMSLFAGDPKFRTKYEIYLGNPKGHIFYAAMQSFAPITRASDKELFKKIIGSIRISPTD